MTTYIKAYFQILFQFQQGSQSSCFAIFLPALVMGNFMVLNLFLALLLNSFNSEELKSKKEEVGDESKLTKSFERIRSIVRKGRLRRKPQEDDGASKLEKLVHQIVEQQRLEKKGILVNAVKRNSDNLSPPLYSKSYQESLNRPLSGSNLQYDLNVKDNQNVVKTISGSQETVTDMDDQQQLPDDKRYNGILHQMSSGFGTQQSKDEPFDLSEAVELKALGPLRKGIPQQIQKRQSCPMPRNFNSQAHAIDTNSNSSSCTYSEISKQLKRLSSNQSINTLSLDQDELLHHINLKDELLNCDKKELFQFLRDENFFFDNFYNEPPSSTVNIDMADVRKSVHIQEDVEMMRSPDKHLKNFEKLPSVTKISELNEATGKPWHCLVSYVDDLTVGGRKNSQGEYIDPATGLGFGKVKEPKIPVDCFPKGCYERCSCWDECLKTKAGIKWMALRTATLELVDTPAFEWIVLVLIFASSVTLCFEDIHLDKNPGLKYILYWTNFVFSLIFVVEMFLKWIAHGFTKYFTSFWTILDFIIVFVSIIESF
jgi:Ion transport protein